MNIFKLSYNAHVAAMVQSDKHVIKMPLESIQLLCTCKRVLDGELTTVYIPSIKVCKWNPEDPTDSRTYTRVKLRKRVIHVLPCDTIKTRFGTPILTAKKLYLESHVNHPCAKWVRESVHNYYWLHKHAYALCMEYKYRFGKTHASAALLSTLLDSPTNIPLVSPTLPAQAMPIQYRQADPVAAYWEYYRKEKRQFKQRGGYVDAKWTRRVIPLQFFNLNIEIRDSL